MKTLSVVALFTVLLGLGVAHANTQPTAAPTPAARAGATPDDATLMSLAQTGLASARENLLHVSHEYGGHRAKATQAINTALQELKLAKQADSK